MSLGPGTASVPAHETAVGRRDYIHSDSNAHCAISSRAGHPVSASRHTAILATSASRSFLPFSIAYASSINSSEASDLPGVDASCQSPLNRTVYLPTVDTPVGSDENFGVVS